MAAKAAELLVRIKTDTSQAKADLDQTAGVFGKMGDTLGKVFNPATIAAGAVGMGAALWKVTSMASDLNETLAAGQVIFGDAAPQLDFAANSAKAFGMARTDAVAAANTFGALGKAAGLAGDDLVDFSGEMVGLARDLASFKNTSPEEAIVALGSAMRGEMEPIRKYDIMLDDATMRQEALSMGIIKTTKDALTPQQKILAAHSLIMKKSADAQGDFERTSGGMANQTRILTAEFKNWATELGQKVLPLATDLVKWINDQVIPALKDFAQVAQDKLGQALGFLSENVFPKVSQAFDSLKSAAEPVIKWMSENLDTAGAAMAVFGTVVGFAVVGLALAFWNLAAAVVAATWPFLLIAAAVAGLWLGLKFLWDNVPGFRDAVTQAFQAIRDFINPIMDSMGARFQSFLDFLDNTFIPAVSNLWEWFKAVLDVVVGFVQDHWDSIAEIYRNVWDIIKNLVANAWQVISNIFQFFLNLIKGDWGAAWDNIKNIVSAVWDAITNVIANAFGIIREILQIWVDVIADIASAMWEPIPEFLGGIVDKVESMFWGLIDFIKSIPGRIAGVFSGLWDAIPKPPSWIPGIGGQAFVPMPTVAGRGLTAQPVALAPAASAPTLGRQGMVINISIQHSGLGVDSPQLQRDLVEALNRYVSRNGRSRIPVGS